MFLKNGKASWHMPKITKVVYEWLVCKTFISIKKADSLLNWNTSNPKRHWACELTFWDLSEPLGLGEGGLDFNFYVCVFKFLSRIK